MRAVTSRAIAVMAALALAGCVTPTDFDTGGAIRAVNATAAELAAPQTVHFATTRCHDGLGAGPSGYPPKSWKATAAGTSR